MMLILVVSLICLFWHVNACQSRMDSPRLRYSPEPTGKEGLIWYKPGYESTSKIYTTEIKKFLLRYNTSVSSLNQDGCNGCSSLSKTVIPCISETKYGYTWSSTGPCIFLYFENFRDWKPEFYTSSNIPENLPENLRYYIKHHNTEDLVWVNCEGETTTDKENIGPILYLPERGFSRKYFPYQKNSKILSPFIAIHLEEPTHGIVISIQCKAWAKNIDHEKGEGIVQFDLLID